MSSPTPTTTQTPTPTQIICGSGITQSSYVYYDCCGNSVVGSGEGQIVTFDYTRANVGITKLNISTSIICPTPSQTVTKTPTVTPTKTPSVTTTQTLTPTPTSSEISVNPNNALRQFNKGSQPQNLINSCDVFESAPLGIECRTLAIPSTATSNDGSLAVLITGGTPPYSIYWNNIQNNNEILTNLTQGVYTILVVDNFGDYSAITSCSLNAPTPTMTQTQTQTMTPTPTPVPPYICFTFSLYGEYFAWSFSPNGIRNGYFTWRYVDPVGFVYDIYWDPIVRYWYCVCDNTNGNCGLRPYSTNGGIWFISQTTSNIPLTQWKAQGKYSSLVQPTLSVTSGNAPNCFNVPSILTITAVDTTESSCGGANDGSIVVYTTGGQYPLTFTLDNGVPQASNIFPSVGSGTHTVTVRDSSTPPVSTSRRVSIVTSNPSSIYTVYIRNLGSTVSSSSSGPTSTTQSVDWIVDVVPALVTGDVLNITLSIESLQYVNGPGFGIITSNTVLEIDGVQQTPASITTTSSVNPRPFCPETVTFSGINETYATIQYDNTTVISGTVTSILTIPSGAGSIDVANCVTLLEQDINVNIIDVAAQGCSCCSAVASSIPGGITNHTFEAQNTDSDQEMRIQLYGVQNIKFQTICSTTPYRVVWGDTSSPSVLPAGCSQAGTPNHTYTNVGGYTGDLVIKMPSLANLDSLFGFTTTPTSILSSNPKYFPVIVKTSELFKANASGTLPGLNNLYLDDSVLLTGTVTQLPSKMTSLWVNQTTISGFISDLPSTLSNIIIGGENQLTGYTQGHQWVNPMSVVYISGTSVTIPTTSVDNILQDLSTYSWTGLKLIQLRGQRSSNSDSAYNSLISDGVTINLSP